MAETASPAPPLQVEGLSFSWPNGQTAVCNCQLTVPKPGLWMLVGSNGSGKSTLLRLIAGLLEPGGGTIRTTAQTALVFQNPDHQLFLPSCGSQLRLALGGRSHPDSTLQQVEAALAVVGLAGLQARPIHALSGGQKQRLAIAAALASGSRLLLLDEPTALLDPHSQREVLELIAGLTHRATQPLTALWITHRLEELELCDAAAFMQRGSTGNWQSGAELRKQLMPLPAGRSNG
ncbi:MAG: ABC transporter ATP-binding protein [Cyanobacteriota bacterium]|nr:ABC transporter ATP-binding protein [Cyanobacteriota bacterium]